MPDNEQKKHWHEGWAAAALLFTVIVTALSYPVLLSHGFGYQLSLVMSLLIFIILGVVIIVTYAGLKTDQELRRHGIYDRAKAHGKRLRDRFRRKSTRKAQAKGGNKEG